MPPVYVTLLFAHVLYTVTMLIRGLLHYCTILLELHTLMRLGSGVFASTKVPEGRNITLNLRATAPSRAIVYTDSEYAGLSGRFSRLLSITVSASVFKLDAISYSCNKCSLRPSSKTLFYTASRTSCITVCPDYPYIHYISLLIAS